MRDERREPSKSAQGQSRLRFFYPLAMVVSLIIGLLVPSFYEWTGSNQSRSTSRVSITAGVLSVGVILIWIALFWMPRGQEYREAEYRENESARPWTFSTRELFLAIALIAGLLVALIKAPLLVSGGLCAIAYAYGIWFWFRMPGRRWQTAALFASMTFPFVWIFGYGEVGNVFPAMLGIAAAMPGFFPAALIGSLFHQNPNDLFWVGVLLTAGEWIVGIGFIRYGCRSTIAYLAILLLMTTFGSFGLNALIRA